MAADRRRPAPSASAANVLLRHGRFRPLEDVPGATSTAYAGLNDRGQAVGSYLDANGALLHGLLRERDGRTRTIDPPGAQFTIVYDINNRGQMVGTYIEAGAVPDATGYAPPGTQHAFLWDKARSRSSTRRTPCTRPTPTGSTTGAGSSA